MLKGYQQLVGCLVIGMIFSAQLSADTAVDDKRCTKSFQVVAQVNKGCLLGGDAADTNHFGTIAFGTVNSLAQDRDTMSSKGAGSIIIKCNPGISVTIAIDSGAQANASIANGRYLINSKTNEKLRYQLYQDTAYSVVWGNGGNGAGPKQVITTGLIEEHVVYARLFAGSSVPSPGNYSDTLLVTIDY